mgnify:CR=1 FL=1
MENAADALKMAAAVLVFVLALGISISSFSQARYTAEVLIQYADRDTVTQYAEDTGLRTRIVGKETIVPTIYRAYKENYKIFFYDSGGNPIVLYTKVEKGVQIEVNSIDLEKDVIGESWQQDNFIMALLYGNKGTYKRMDGSTMTYQELINQLYENNSGLTFLYSEGIYDTILGGNTFEEKLGVYYQNDLLPEDYDPDPDISGDEFGESSTPDTNKIPKRVISYYKQ